MNLYQVLILLSIYCSTIVAVIAIPFFNKHSSSASSSNSSPTTHHSSLLLQHHRTIYTNRRPHDTSLYDILNVKSNATLAEIQKSWRRKSLQWHPDKLALRRRQKERGSDGINYNEKSGRDVHTVVVPPPPPPPPRSDDHRIIKGQDGQNNNNDIDNNKQNEHDQDEEYARNQLQKIQHAYEILSDDHNRLLYHKYGLIGGTDAAVQLLTGRATSASTASGGIMNDGGATTAEQIRLLELMGYHHTHQNQHQFPSSSASHEQRIHTLTTTITEYLRPLVEGTISQDNFVSQIHSEMNTLKKSPLGAQILRCVGRAYKVEGWRVLRQMREEKYRQRYGRSYSQNRHRHHSSSSRKRNNGQKNSRVDDILQDSWRSTKHYASAAYASGKLVLMEQKLKKLEEDQLRQKEERRRKKRMREEEEDRLKRIQGCSDESNNHVFSSNIGSLSDDEDEEFDIGSFSDIDLDNNNNDSDSDMMMFSASESEDSDDDDDEIEYELQHIQNQKAYTALLSLHQMEALWKVTKIELDSTVREACRWILAPTPSSVPAIAGGSGGRSEGGGGWYAFCPSEQSPYQEDWRHYQASPPPPPPPPPPSSHHGEHYNQQRHHQHRRRLRQQRQQQQHRRPRKHSKADGWVGLNGQVVPMEVGRLRAAAAMVLVGDIMVRCSKEGTAWKKNK